MEDEVRLEKSQTIDMPRNVRRIIDVLEKAGYEAYIVGGCVRDALLLKEPHDWDITTSATPEQVKRLFSHTVDTGIKHGTVTVLFGSAAYEVTTYRIDGEYLDGRHPENVQFTSLLSEDLKRRDFTINAMAYHPERGLVDLFDGQGDLKNHVIRCVGLAHERFSEDALRVMRAVRFSAQLNFSIADETRAAISDLAPNLKQVSHERIRDELMKLLCSDHSERMLDLYELGLTAQFFPEFDQMMVCAQNTKYHCYTVGMHTLKVIENTGPDTILRLAALLHDVGKLYTKTEKDGVDHFYGHADVSAERAEKFLRDMRFDNDTTKQVCTLVKYHDPRMELTESHVRTLMHDVGIALFPPLIELMRADMLAKSAYAMRSMSNVDRLEEIFVLCRDRGDCVTLKDMAINGDDLSEIGIPKGRRVGEILNALLTEVINDPGKNDRDTLLSMAEAMNKK